MQERTKEHDRDIRLARTQTSAVSEHANETGHLPIFNRDSGIEIRQAWIPTIRKHNSRRTTKRTCVREQHLIVGIIMRTEMQQ